MRYNAPKGRRRPEPKGEGKIMDHSRISIARMRTAALYALALACCLSIEELIGNGLASPWLTSGTQPITGQLDHGTGAFLELCAVQFVVVGIVAAFAPKAPKISPPSIVAAEILPIVVGCVCLVPSQRIPLLYAIGLALVTIGCTLAKTWLLLQLVLLPLNEIKLVTITMLLMQAAFLAIGQWVNLWTVGCIALCGCILGALIFFLAHAKSTDTNNRRRSVIRNLGSPATIATIAAGFFFLCAAATFFTPVASSGIGLSGAESTPSFNWTAQWLVTKSAVAAIAVVLLFLIEDPSYYISVRMAATLVLLSLIGMLILGDTNLAFGVSLVSLSLLELVSLVAAVDLASYSAANPTRIVCAYLLLFRGAEIFGCIGGLVDEKLPALASNYSAAGLVLCVLAVVATVWLASEHNLNRMFWAFPPTSRAGEGTASLPSLDQLTHDKARAAELSADFGFSPRETEVALLLCQGRSSTFIAEELFLSANTVRSHIARIYAKADVHSKQDFLTKVQEWNAWREREQEKNPGASRSE